MTHPSDSHRPHRTRWLFTAAAALMLLASVGWAQQASAADPHSSGDGVLTSACGEQCDDGGESATCNADCTLAQCGDGTLNVTTGEQCDDGNRNPFDGCANECAVCGDGVVTPPEECDDGNTSSGDSCDAQCHSCDVPCRQSSVVGTGTPQSCTETAFAAALAQRSVTFNCGPAPVTITVTRVKAISADTVIEGGGLITLSGGGAVQIFTVPSGAALDVRNLTIADGRTVADGVVLGGGIYNAGTLTLTNCTLNDNSAVGVASSGGGIYNSGTLTLTNCTLSGNSATDRGGGIYNGYDGMLTLANCTLSGNSAEAGGRGGAIFNSSGFAVPNVSGGAGPGTLTLRTTIVGNSPSGGDCAGAGEINDGGHNLIENATYSCGLSNGVNGNIVGVDPLLGPLVFNGGPTQTHALCTGPGAPHSECAAGSCFEGRECVRQ